jgi:hypothetical protein
MYFRKLKKNKTYPTGLGRARGPNPTRSGPATDPAEAHPAGRMAAAVHGAAAASPWRACQGSLEPRAYKGRRLLPCEP